MVSPTLQQSTVSTLCHALHEGKSGAIMSSTIARTDENSRICIGFDRVRPIVALINSRKDTRTAVLTLGVNVKSQNVLSVDGVCVC